MPDIGKTSQNLIRNRKPMKFYRLTLDTDNGIQAVTDLPPAELIKKDLYTPYKGSEIDCIRLDLDKGKRKTSFLQMGDLTLHGFPAQSQVVDLIRNFNLEKVQFVKITDPKLTHYQLVFFNSDLTPKLDYTMSDLIFIKDFLGDIEELDIKVPKNRRGAIKTYLKFAYESSFHKMVPKNGYHFIPGFDVNKLDIFRIGHFDTSFYVSETVKNVLEEAKVTGVNFRESDLFNRTAPLLERKKSWWPF